MSVKRVCWIGASSICIAMFLACTGQSPTEAQRSVEKAPPESVKELTAKELDELFRAKDQKDGRPQSGPVYDVQGTIKSITIQQNSDKKLERYEINVVVKDYAAVVVVCRFAPEHLQALVTFNTGETVKVRGRLSGFQPFGGNAISLNGCIFPR